MASNGSKKTNNNYASNSTVGNTKSSVASNRSSAENNTEKRLFTEAEANALQNLHKSLSEILLVDFNSLTNVISQHFWPQDLHSAIPLLDGISKLNPKFQQKMHDKYLNQAYRQTRLRWTQADSIYCLAFKLPQNGYYLAKVGMTATKGEYDKSENTTSSRFEKLKEDFTKQLFQSKLGQMDLQDSQPTFKFIVSPYDTNNVQDIEKLIREKLGWSVQKSVMQHYKISVPTEWIIIPPEQSKYLYDKVLGMKQSQNIHMLDTRVLDGLPKLNDNEKVSEFKWKNKNINENVIFKPFDKIIPSSRIHETDDLSNSSTSVDGIHLNVLNISSPPVSKQSKANKPSANANETIKKPSDQKQKQQKIM